MKNTNSSEILAGVILSIIGCIIIAMNSVVYFSWYSFGASNISSGIVLIPLFISVVMLVAMENKTPGKIVFVISVLALILALILSMRIHIKQTNLFNLLIMFMPLLIGIGLIVKACFARAKKG